MLEVGFLTLPFFVLALADTKHWNELVYSETSYRLYFVTFAIIM